MLAKPNGKSMRPRVSNDLAVYIEDNWWPTLAVWLLLPYLCIKLKSNLELVNLNNRSAEAINPPSDSYHCLAYWIISIFVCWLRFFFVMWSAVKIVDQIIYDGAIYLSIFSCSVFWTIPVFSISPFLFKELIRDFNPKSLQSQLILVFCSY